MAKPTEEELAAGMAYVQRGRGRPKGWLLAHNHIQHGRYTRQSVNGFRYFWIASREGWSFCRCGWRPDLGPHYSKDDPKQELLNRVRE
jgi:hypothetical protein